MYRVIHKCRYIAENTRNTGRKRWKTAPRATTAHFPQCEVGGLVCGAVSGMFGADVSCSFSTTPRQREGSSARSYNHSASGPFAHLHLTVRIGSRYGGGRAFGGQGGLQRVGNPKGGDRSVKNYIETRFHMRRSIVAQCQLRLGHPHMPSF